ncbi:MAG: RsmB/NOP family class I SAM-dependent RNA methyltransferase [Gammaproteobacteria bacterium]|nr:RsmB/NOP family class I SAM-dependent RNA methyltransferase [Gammaproteobacteria bacterium]
MITPALHEAAARLLDDILGGPGAADARMDRFFRAQPRLGPKDRGVIAETVYGSLRHHRLLCAFAQTAEPRRVVAAWLAAFEGYNARQLQALGVAHPEALVAAARSDRDIYPFAVSASLPDWLAARLATLLPASEHGAAATALLAPAPLDIRTNTLKTERAALQQSLARAGHDLSPTPLSPWGLRRAARAGLFRTPEFAAGHFEVQDEGSQLIAPLLEPRRGERIVDYCAGAGGKTLHLSALLANSGMLYAFDTSQKRLGRLRERATRAGCDNIRIQTLETGPDNRLKRLYGKIDRVLVDAPCSGTGTVRRSPDIKWRLAEERVTELAGQARAILTQAARLVRPGGRLLYVTCSVLREENEDVIADFLAEHGGDYTPIDTHGVSHRS